MSLEPTQRGELGMTWGHCPGRDTVGESGPEGERGEWGVKANQTIKQSEGGLDLFSNLWIPDNLMKLTGWRFFRFAAWG